MKLIYLWMKCDQKTFDLLRQSEKSWPLPVILFQEALVSSGQLKAFESNYTGCLHFVALSHFITWFETVTNSQRNIPSWLFLRERLYRHFLRAQLRHLNLPMHLNFAGKELVRSKVSTSAYASWFCQACWSVPEKKACDLTEPGQQQISSNDLW